VLDGRADCNRPERHAVLEVHVHAFCIAIHEQMGKHNLQRRGLGWIKVQHSYEDGQRSSWPLCQRQMVQGSVDQAHVVQELDRSGMARSSQWQRPNAIRAVDLFVYQMRCEVDGSVEFAGALLSMSEIHAEWRVQMLSKCGARDLVDVDVTFGD
jgi:hypothetical protein